MAKLNRFLDSFLDPRSGASRPRRTLALALAVVLVFASVSPAWAVTVEVESEAEGSAPPGNLPGLEEGPELEPEGEETELGEAPPLVSEEGEEESPPEDEESAPPASSAAVESSEPEVPVGPTAQTGATSPNAEPVNEEDGGPNYEAAPPLVVRGEPIAAPPAPSTPPQHEVAKGGQTAVPPSPESPSSAAAPPAGAPTPTTPSSAAPQPAATPPADPAAPGAIAARRFHTVRPGESLWSIATALLPARAGNAEIAAEVQRLWRLNEARIGTGDLNMILVGTVLRLR